KGFFQARGVAVSVAGLSTLLASRAVEAAPAALAAAVSGNVIVAGAGASAGIAKGTIAMMTWAKAKIAMLCAAAVLTVGTAGGVVIHHHFRAQAAAPAKPQAAPSVPVLAVADAKNAQPAEEKLIEI